MIIKDAKNKGIEISDRHWSLAENLFLKWGHHINGADTVIVGDLNLITPELSAWGIPWKRTSWE